MKQFRRVRVGSPRRGRRQPPPPGGVLGPVLLTVLVAEGGVRALRPKEAATEPAPVDLDRYFSPEEVRRGARFARPQVAIGMARSILDLAALAAVVRRTRPGLPRLGGPPEAGGAEVAAALAVGMTVVSLPLSALARRRARAVGLVTQSWGGWAGDLVKSTGIEATLAGVRALRWSR